MAWRKVPEELKELLDGALAVFPVEKRRMFGCPAYFINNNMFTGAHQESIMLRLSPEDREAIAKEHGVGLFEPFVGRPMREYVSLPGDLATDPTVLGPWLERAFAYASSLPPKKKKPKMKTK